MILLNRGDNMVTYIIYCIIEGKEIPIKISGFMNTDIEKLDAETIKYQNKDEINIELMKKGVLKQPADDFVIKYSLTKAKEANGEYCRLPILYRGDNFIKEAVVLRYKEYMLNNPAIIRTKIRQISNYVRSRVDFNKDVKTDNSDDLELMNLYERTKDSYQNISFSVEKLSRRLLKRYRDYRDTYFLLKTKNQLVETIDYGDFLPQENLQDKYGNDYKRLIQEEDSITDDDYLIYDEVVKKHR